MTVSLSQIMKQHMKNTNTKEIDATEEETGTARNMIRTTSACRSSSVPVRKSLIKKNLTRKRQASSSPVKDDTQFKEKLVKLQYSK